MSMSKKLMRTALTVTLLLAAAALPAQGPAPYIVVHYDEIDPSGVNEFEANSLDWVKAFTEAGLGADQSYRAYSSDFTYAWVSDLPNYAHLDSQEERWAAAREAVGEAKMEALMSGGNDAVQSHYTEIWKHQPDLSYAPESFSPEGMNAINVGIQHVKPGKGDEFRGVVKDVVAAMQQIEADVNFFAYSIPFGEGSFAFVSWGENRAALHSGPQMGALLTEALGAEGSQALFGRWVATINAVEESDWRVRRDLSYVPEAAGDEAGDEGGE